MAKYRVILIRTKKPTIMTRPLMKKSADKLKREVREKYGKRLRIRTIKVG